MKRAIKRLENGIRKVLAGLTPFGENVSPEVQNDLFQAHRSIYHFFGRFARDRRVLDLGCGAGYGSGDLLEYGAAAVVGIDLDQRNVRYARRRFATSGVTFLQGDAEALPQGLGRFGLVVSSNVFEHLNHPEAALDRVHGLLEHGGLFILAVPPILDRASMDANERIPYHRTNKFVSDWSNLLRARFDEVRSFTHLPPAGASLDFESPFASSLEPTTFRFDESEIGQPGYEQTMTAVLVCKAPVTS